MGRYSIIEDGVVVNQAEASAAYAKEQGWILARDSGIGWTWDGKQYAEPAQPARTIPQAVSSRQAKRALLEAGLLDGVLAAIAQIPDDLQRRRVQIDWDEATEFKRDWPTLQMLAVALDLDDVALDELFIAAANL